MSVQYHYTTADFPNGVDASFLEQEISLDEIIQKQLVKVVIFGTDVDIYFDQALDAAELTQLNTIIANHVPPTTGSYAVLGTNMPDPQAVQILAVNPAGGILIRAGTGGILVETTNALMLRAGAASEFTTTLGNILIHPVGLLNLASSSGINIGANGEASPINIGTDIVPRVITLGNLTAGSGVHVIVGTESFVVSTSNGGAVRFFCTGALCNWTLTTTGPGQNLFLGVLGNTDSHLILSSEGTSESAIQLSALSGGIRSDIGIHGYRMYSTGPVYISSSQAAGASIFLDSPSGGIALNSGVFGLTINSLGTSPIFIGNFGDTGDIAIGNSPTRRSVYVGNTVSTSQTILRNGTQGLWKTQQSEVVYTDADQTATITELLTGMLVIPPTLPRTITLPTAAAVMTGASGLTINDSFDFTVINTGTDAVTIAMGAGGVLLGSNVVVVGTSKTFRLRLTNVTATTEAYTVYTLS